jgi:hypothetical protein
VPFSAEYLICKEYNPNPNPTILQILLKNTPKIEKITPYFGQDLKMKRWDCTIAPLPLHHDTAAAP